MVTKCKNGGGILSNTHKGFTLIELLAVIVILAIIALIATPIILNIVNGAKKSASVDSAYGYIKAIENINSMNMLDSKKYEKIEDGIDIEATSILSKINLKGTKPTSGTINITNGKVTSANICINNYKVIYDGNTAKVNGSCSDKTYNVYEDGTAIYYNPIIGKTCNAKDVISTTGTKAGCMKFYTFNDLGKYSSEVNMILDHHTTAFVAWNSSGNNTHGMNEAKIALENDTANWKQTARLITADEIAEITKAKEILNWTSDKLYADVPVIGESISWYYLDGSIGKEPIWKTQNSKLQGESKYAWLFDNLSNCKNYGCNVEDNNKYRYGESGNMNYLYGYWLDTPVVFINNSYAWNINYRGELNNGEVQINYDRGIRPVISVEKSLID